MIDDQDDDSELQSFLPSFLHQLHACAAVDHFGLRSRSVSAQPGLIAAASICHLNNLLPLTDRPAWPAAWHRSYCITDKLP